MDLLTLNLNEETKNVLVLLHQINEKVTKTNKAYCDLSVSDTEGNMYDLRFWNSTKKEVLEVVQEKTVISADIFVQMYNDARSYEARAIRLPNEPADLKAFIRMPKRDIEELYQECLAMISPDTVYGQIVHNTYKIFKKELCSRAGGQRIHHDYVGGLIEHLHGVGRLAIAVAAVYPDIDRDMLVAGALIHDIGKVCEMNTDGLGVTEYTISGRQLGHLALGIKILMKVTMQMGLYNTKERQILEAMIASHHGKEEFGALKKPDFKEAHFLYMIDDMDAKNNVFDKEYKNLEHGEMSDSKCFALGNIYVWRP